jgi:putative endonuclease
VPFVRATRPTTRDSTGLAGGGRTAGTGREDPRRSLGRLGEQLAAAHLERLGFATLARNVRTGHGEIDLIVFDGRTLAFVEVKTRRVRAAARPSATGPQPLAWLRQRQQVRIRRLACAWLSDTSAVRPRAATIRFDAIGVTVDRGGQLMALEHVEGAW